VATLLLLRRWQAVKIALEVKKYLVDHSMLEVTQVSTSVSGRQAFVYSCIWLCSWGLLRVTTNMDVEEVGQGSHCALWQLLWPATLPGARTHSTGLLLSIWSVTYPLVCLSHVCPPAGLILCSVPPAHESLPSPIPYLSTCLCRVILPSPSPCLPPSSLPSQQEELERILLQLITAKGLGSQYIDCYKMVTQFFQQRQPLIIVICGTAWTGEPGGRGQTGSHCKLYWYASSAPAVTSCTHSSPRLAQLVGCSKRPSWLTYALRSQPCVASNCCHSGCAAVVAPAVCVWLAQRSLNILPPCCWFPYPRQVYHSTAAGFPHQHPQCDADRRHT
jgi:hypothetical protein